MKLSRKDTNSKELVKVVIISLIACFTLSCDSSNCDLSHLDSFYYNGVQEDVRVFLKANSKDVIFPPLEGCATDLKYDECEVVFTIPIVYKRDSVIVEVQTAKIDRKWRTYGVMIK